MKKVQSNFFVLLKAFKTACAVALIILVSTNIKAQNAKVIFEKANSFYKFKQYDEAEHLYLNVLSIDRNNINAAYNLGNTYYHLKNYPKAILYYEKALKLAPGDKKITRNLELTNNKLFTKMEFSKEFFVIKYWKNFLNSRSSSQWSHHMLFFLWIGVFCLCIYFFTTNSWMKKTGALFILLALFFGAIAYHRLGEENTSHYAIVLSDNSILQQAPVPEAKTLDSIQAGLKVKLTGRDSGWLKVELPNGKSGWISTQNASVI